MGRCQGRAESAKASGDIRRSVTAFDDEFAIDAADEEHSEKEERRVLIGLSEELRLLTVVYTE